MPNPASNIEQELQQKIEKMASIIADDIAKQKPPDPLINQDQLKSKIKEDIKEQLTQFFERLIAGMNEVVETVQIISKIDKEILSDQVDNEMENLQDLFKRLADSMHEGEPPNEASGLSTNTIRAFNRAAAFLYENQHFDKSAAVYALLAFIDPNEMAYWIGYGNSEYFNMNFYAALRAYAMAAEVNPQDPHSHLYSSHCFHMLGQQTLALDSVDKALNIIKENPSLKEWEVKADQLKVYYKENPKKQ